jgi:hypothetical protein
VQLIIVGELHYRASARRSFEWALHRRQELEEELIRRREEAARKAHAAQLAAEKARRTALLAMTADLRAADDIRSLVSRVLAKRGLGDEAASRWAAWAIAVADRLDPSDTLMINPTDCAQHLQSNGLAQGTIDNVDT